MTNFTRGDIVGKRNHTGWIGEVEKVEGDRVSVIWQYDKVSTAHSASELKLREVDAVFRKYWVSLLSEEKAVDGAVRNETIGMFEERKVA